MSGQWCTRAVSSERDKGARRENWQNVRTFFLLYFWEVTLWGAAQMLQIQLSPVAVFYTTLQTFLSRD